MIVLFVGAIVPFYGQDAMEKDKKQKEKIDRPNAIFVAPLNLINPENPNFQIGYERFLSKNWALQIEGGIIINHGLVNYFLDWVNGIKNCPFTNKGFRVKGSVKYILIHKRKMKLYVSPELFYARNKSGIVSDFLISDPDFEYPWTVSEGATSYSHFFYNDEEKVGMNIKVGIKLLFGKSFFMEPHLGVGLAHRNVIQTDVVNPEDKSFGLFGILDKAAPNKWAPTIPLNINMGFRF